MQKQREKVWEILSCTCCDIIIGRQTGEQCLTKQDLSYIYLVKGLLTTAFDKQCQYSSLFGRFEADQRKLRELRRLGIALCVSTFCLSNVIVCDWISQALPLHFGILEPIKNCSQRRPRNKAHQMQLCLSLAPRPHCCTCRENGSGQLPLLFSSNAPECTRKILFCFSLDIIEGYIPLCVPTIL